MKIRHHDAKMPCRHGTLRFRVKVRRRGRSFLVIVRRRDRSFLVKVPHHDTMLYLLGTAHGMEETLKMTVDISIVPSTGILAGSMALLSHETTSQLPITVLLRQIISPAHLTRHQGHTKIIPVQ